MGWAPVSHSCNSSNSGGGDQEDHSLKPAQANSSWDSRSGKNPVPERTDRVAQVVKHLPHKPNKCEALSSSTSTTHTHTHTKSHWNRCSLWIHTCLCLWRSLFVTQVLGLWRDWNLQTLLMRMHNGVTAVGKVTTSSKARQISHDPLYMWKNYKPGMVTHSYNLSYLGGRGRSLRPAWAKLAKLYLKNK
jgi:hypothetical protein